ncbi:hypothetical protein [Sphingobacterium kitahiroshimense]|uniref:hypothetical protein n=1 Tax=Sphingobacterium kitahiroshimense TaxID=470446 RepID=UPI00320800C4
MNLKEKATEKRLGLIVAAILENANQPQTNDPDRPSSNENDLRERRQEENVASNPDPELEDPNFVPDEDDESTGTNEDPLDDVDVDEEDRRDRDDLIDPIDPLNNMPGEEDIDPDDEDPLELPEEDEDELDEIDSDDEVPVEEKDDLGQSRPAEFPDDDDEESDILYTGEIRDDFLQERDSSDQSNRENKDYDHDDRDLEEQGLEEENDRGNFL